MPIYDYQCSCCGFKDEVMRKVSAPSIEACPKCAAETFTKQLSAPSFQLNGSGWYATDFKHGNNKPAKTDSNSKAEANNSDSTKTSDIKTDAPKADAAVEKKSNAASAACTSGCSCH